MQLQPGTRLGRYEVREKIGAGGMGVVYLAQDTSLRRPVALKVLPTDLTRNEERLRRFEQEAFAASALNHPHILTVYEIGSEGDTHFIATELVEGVTLRQHAAGRPLPPRELLDIATQIASALAAAHEAGIVHRDVKPENVMLRRDGYVKVVDFGLAKLTRPRYGRTDIDVSKYAGMPPVNTQPGVVMGTVAYMSPEQARGLEVDARTDLWSLGVVLYELAAGRPPFTGATPSDVMAAVLTSEPPRLEEHIPDAPEGLLSVLRRALEKEPGARYQTAAEMLADLRRLKRRAEAESESGETRADDSRTAARHAGEGAARADVSPSRDARDTPPDQEPERSVEIAHVLFTDIVGYSRLPMDEQGRVLRRLQEIVRGTREYRRARESDQLISLPTGDGMALVFFGDPEAPALCAVEISRALGERPSVGLRMGVHTGPVYLVDDINASRNVAGGGINTAQRVMDCGDAGHILVSGAAAEVLGQLSGWQGKLSDLGEAEVKHGVRVRLFNLFADGAGNPELPQKLKTYKPAGAARGAGGAGAKWIAAGLALLLVCAAAAAGAAYWMIKRGGERKVTATVEYDNQAAPAPSASPDAAAGLGALLESAGDATEASPSPAPQTDEAADSGAGASESSEGADSLVGKWVGTYGPMSQPATLNVEEAAGGRIRGVLEQGGVRVAFEGRADPATRAVTFKETRVLSGDGWSLGDCKGQMSSDGRMMSGTGQDPFGAQLGMSFQWSFNKQ